MPAQPIDLRSDTVTRPSAGMRRAMAEAPVGDDQYGEDPSVNRLQQRIAEMLGKEAALFVPSGTMANQIAMKLLTRAGDEVLVGEHAHMMWHESGAGAANSGVQFTPLGRGGLFTADDVRAACKPPGHIVLPPTGLVAIENTHNLGGGVVFPQTQAVDVCDTARKSRCREKRILPRADMVERSRDRHVNPVIARAQRRHFLGQLAERVRTAGDERIMLGQRLVRRAIDHRGARNQHL